MIGNKLSKLKWLSLNQFIFTLFVWCLQPYNFNPRNRVSNPLLFVSVQGALTVDQVDELTLKVKEQRHILIICAKGLQKCVKGGNQFNLKVLLKTGKLEGRINFCLLMMSSPAYHVIPCSLLLLPC